MDNTVESAVMQHGEGERVEREDRGRVRKGGGYKRKEEGREGEQQEGGKG